MAVTTIPNVTNWSVTPQNGQANYFTLMNTWLGESTSVIASLNNAINAQNIANEEINQIALNAIEAITLDTIEDLATYDGLGTVIVKDRKRGGLFEWSATGVANGIYIFAGLTGFWHRVNPRTIRKQDANIGSDLKPLVQNGCTIRKNTGINTNWFIINDDEHDPIDFDTISTTNSHIDVSVANIAHLGNTGSVVCGVDETYATHGLFVGASVSSSLARVKIAKHIRGLLNIATGGISCLSVSIDNFYGTKDANGITITHPKILDGAKITLTPRNFGIEVDKIYIESETTTSTRIIPLKTIELIATKIDGSWTYTTGSTALNSALSGILTISETGAIITITHPASFFGTVHHVTSAPVYKSSTEFSQLTFYTPTNSTETKANLRYKAGIPVDSVDGDKFRLVLHDLIWLVGGEVTVDLGVVQLDPIKDLANISTGANIWINGINWAK